jgi:hypothetical protein
LFLNSLRNEAAIRRRPFRSGEPRGQRPGEQQHLAAQLNKLC